MTHDEEQHLAAVLARLSGSIGRMTEKVDRIESVVLTIEKEAKATNGRVTRLEREQIRREAALAERDRLAHEAEAHDESYDRDRAITLTERGRRVDRVVTLITGCVLLLIGAAVERLT